MNRDQRSEGQHAWANHCALNKSSRSWMDPSDNTTEGLPTCCSQCGLLHWRFVVIPMHKAQVAGGSVPGGLASRGGSVGKLGCPALHPSSAPLLSAHICCSACKRQQTTLPLPVSLPLCVACASSQFIAGQGWNLQHQPRAHKQQARCSLWSHCEASQ